MPEFLRNILDFTNVIKVLYSMAINHIGNVILNYLDTLTLCVPDSLMCVCLIVLCVH